MNHLLLLACHTNSLIKKNSLLHNIQYFTELCNNVVIIQSSEYKDKLVENYIKKINPNIIFYYTPNDKHICQGKWCSYLNTIDYTKYDNITLTNDSFLITKSLKNYKNLIHKDVELVSLLDSYEVKYHHPDFLRTYNKVGIEKIINYYQSNKHRINTFYDAILYYEVNSSSLFENTKVLYPSKTHKHNNIHYNNSELNKYLYNLNYPIIKLKKLNINYYPNNFQFPNDFNSSEYKFLNGDLAHLNDLELKNHFYNHGIGEGRLYKKNQKNKLPNFLTNYLKNNRLLYIVNNFTNNK